MVDIRVVKIKNLLFCSIVFELKLPDSLFGLAEHNLLDFGLVVVLVRVRKRVQRNLRGRGHSALDAFMDSIFYFIYLCFKLSALLFPIFAFLFNVPFDVLGTLVYLFSNVVKIRLLPSRRSKAMVFGDQTAHKQFVQIALHSAGGNSDALCNVF